MYTLRIYLTAAPWTLLLWLVAAFLLADANLIKAGDGNRASTRQATASPRPTCADPGHPENGYRRDKRSVFYAGHQASFACARGYRLEGADRISCKAYHRDEDWRPTAVRWDADLPQCLPTSPFAYLANGGQLQQRAADPLPCNDYGDITFGSRNITGTMPGDTVSFSCEEDFELLGNPQLTCETDGFWSGAWPICVGVTTGCGDPGTPEFGERLVLGTTQGSTVEYSCLPGCILRGESVRICTETGQWSGSLPVCEAVDCGEPEVTSGDVTFDTTMFGAVAIYSCSEGYVLRGSEAVACQENGTWSNDPPQCIYVDCGHLSDPVNGRVNVEATSLGSTATYFCSPGYSLTGPATRQCTETGQWSGTAPSCQSGSCGTLEHPENGLVFFSSTDTKARATYQCDSAYMLVGDWVRTCFDSGWTGSPPTCVPVECPFPTVPLNGYVSLTNLTFAYSVATYMCRQGYRLYGGWTERVCQTSGLWTGKPPGCYAVDCGPLEDIHNGAVNYTSTLQGSEAIYTCDEGYEIGLGDMIRTCMSNREWSGNPPCCIPIDCSPLSQPTNGDLNLTKGLQLDSVATYSCDAGFQLVDGNQNRTCTSSGWTGFEPSCIFPTDCPALDNPENGEVFFADTAPGSVATYNCSGGYTLEGSSSLICQPSGEWTEDIPTCSPIECEEVLVDPENGEVDVPATTFMSVATYRCINRHTLIGDAERVCLANGTWSGMVPKCQFIECPVLMDPLNGMVVLVPDDNIPGTEAIYTCDRGLGYDGPPSRVCQLNGEWTGVDTNCTEVFCDELESPENGLVILINDNTPGSEALYSCDEDNGYVLTPALLLRRCLATGEWTGRAPQCILMRCPSLEDPANGDVEFDRDIGGTANYTCDLGYRLVGVATRECQSSGQWTGRNPFCERVMCPVLGDPLNGDVVADQRLPGEYARYSCDDGFELQPSILLRLCDSDGQWAGQAPECAPLADTPTCPVLTAPGNGSLELTSTAVGTVVTYACDEGYQLVGSEERTCQNTEEWDRAMPVCELIECPSLSDPLNGTVTIFGNTYQSFATYECDPGHVRVGPEIRFCLETGNWSQNEPTCEEVDCGDLPSPLNGMVDLSPSTFLDSVATYTCNVGFTLQGDDTRTCGDDGQWTEDDEPTCEFTGGVVNCGDPGTPDNGQRTLSSTTIDSTVEYTCDSGYMLEGGRTRTCQANGTWSGELPECSDVMCPPLANPVNGGVALNGMDVGSRATYFCGEDYQLSGPILRECEANGRWAGMAPTCVPIQCPSLSDPENGAVEVGSLETGSTANFTCNLGYVINGEGMLTCDTGEWSSEVPTCERIQCSDPGIPANGRRILDDFKAGERVYFVCDDGYEIAGASVLLCGEDGTWDHSTPICTIANIACSGSGSVVDRFGRNCTCVDGELQSCCRARRDWSMLSDEEKERYISAVLEVATNSSYQQLYHRLVEDYTTSFDTIAQATAGDTSHFFPWHRYFMIYYEDLLRMVDSRITIPYWDWTQMPTMPYEADVFDPTTGFGNTSSSTNNCVSSGPFAEGVFQVTPSAGGGCLEREYNEGYTFPSEEFLETQVLSYIAADFNEFHRALQVLVWLNVRCFVGGNMCFRTAANDPLYLLHVARVDLVLDEWQSLDSDRAEARYVSENIPLVLTLDDNLLVSDFSSNEGLPYGVSVCYGGS